MELETALILILAAVAGTAFAVNYLNAKRNETADAVFWANVRQPLVYEQPDASDETQVVTIAMYENALKKLEEHGNEWLGRTQAERRANVFLWVWGADAKNTTPDFEKWRLLNVQRRANLFEHWRALKAKNFHNQNGANAADAAKVFAPEFDDIGE